METVLSEQIGKFWQIINLGPSYQIRMQVTFHFRLTVAQLLPIWTIFNTATFTHRGKQGQTTHSQEANAVEFLN